LPPVGLHGLEGTPAARPPTLPAYRAYPYARIHSFGAGALLPHTKWIIIDATWTRCEWHLWERAPLRSITLMRWRSCRSTIRGRLRSAWWWWLRRIGRAARRSARVSVLLPVLRPTRFGGRDDIDTIFLLGPNALHFNHLERALGMASVKRIYVEKPLCAGEEEERAIEKGLMPLAGERVVQVGFSVPPDARRAPGPHVVWRREIRPAGAFFARRILHSGYLDKGYRSKRAERMKPAPGGGRGGRPRLARVKPAGGILRRQPGGGGGTPERAVRGCSSRFGPVQHRFAVRSRHRRGGTVTASRISAGAGECLEVEIRCVDGGFRFSTERPDELEVFEAAPARIGVAHCGSGLRVPQPFSGSRSLGGLATVVCSCAIHFSGGPRRVARARPAPWPFGAAAVAGKRQPLHRAGASLGATRSVFK